jgi:peroxiredoxin
LLGSPAPPLELKDSSGKTWKLHEAASDGPVILVFYLGQTCMACVTHTVELDFATSQFRERGAQIMAISADSPEFSRERLRRYGDLQIALLSDADHSKALT